MSLYMFARNTRVFVTAQRLVVVPLPVTVSKLLGDVQRLWIEVVSPGPDRVVVRLYPSPREGAGVSAPVKVYVVKGQYRYKRVILPSVVSRLLIGAGVVSRSPVALRVAAGRGGAAWVELVAPAPAPARRGAGGV